VTNNDRSRWDYQARTAERLEPVTLAPPLWTLTKNGHTAAAHVKAIDGVGLELRALAGFPRLAIPGAGGAGEAQRFRCKGLVRIQSE